MWAFSEIAIPIGRSTPELRRYIELEERRLIEAINQQLYGDDPQDVLADQRWADDGGAVL